MFLKHKQYVAPPRVRYDEGRLACLLAITIKKIIPLKNLSGQKQGMHEGPACIHAEYYVDNSHPLSPSCLTLEPEYVIDFLHIK